MKNKVTLIVFSFVLLAASLVSAQTEVYIRGSGKLFPIAVAQLCVESADAPMTVDKEIPKTINRDLDLSGYFEILDPGKFIETPGKCGGMESVAYSDWSIIGAEGVVRGSVQLTGGRITVRLWLYDVARQQVLVGKEYEGDISQASKIAHKFANEIMKQFTGEAGPFGTQIAFSGKVGRFKELFVMDMDGTNVRQLTNDRALSFSSSWDPEGKRLVFTSYRFRKPDLFVVDVATRQISQITRSGSLIMGAKFLPPGGFIASLSRGTGSELVVLGEDGTIRRKLSPSTGIIDVSPSLSPDGQRMAFCSNRAGGPQIYVGNSDGSNAKRISFAVSSYCTSPAWSPKGDKIAFVCRADRGFNIFVASPDGSGTLQLTGQGDNEDPDWSPDGRYLVFSSTAGKSYVPSIAIMRADGSNMRQLTSSRIGDTEPAWGPKVD